MGIHLITSLWTELGNELRRYRVQLKLSCRVTVAALFSLAFAQLLQLPLPLWVVLTAVIVTQISVGRSVKATLDYLAGTVGGAIYGGAVAAFIPHSTEISLFAVLGLAIAPPAVIAAIYPSLTVAPITAVIVLLVPEMTHTSAIASALDRILEVAVGGVTGLLVSLLFFPSKAHALVADTAGRTLDQMARRELLGGFTRGFDFDSLHRIQDGIGQALLQLQAVGSEAERERSARLAFGPETGPLLRTLLRLRHDLVIVGRAARSGSLGGVGARLEPRLAEVAAAFGEYLSASGAALLARRPPPSLSAAKSALSAHAAEVAALHREWAAQNVPGETAECLSALGSLQQIYENFRDLEQRVAEWAESPAHDVQRPQV